MRKSTLLLSLVMLLSAATFAGGYQVGLHGVKQIGMGLVGTSITNDASVLFYNPGGLTFMKSNYSFAIGLNGIKSYTAYQKTAPSMSEAMTDNPMGTPFYAYAAYKINEKLGIGIAVNTPYGNSLSWGKDWIGRYLIQDLSLKAIFYQPTIAYKICDQVSLGAGLVYATGDFELNKGIPVFDSEGEGSVMLEGSTSSFGFNAGILVKPVDGLNVGVNYRSAIDMEIDDATATFNVPVSLQSNFPNTTVATTLPLPANLDLGVSYQFNDNFVFAVSLNYVFWGRYDSLIFDFKDNTSSLADSRNPRLYSDRLIVRAGGEYKISNVLQVRAGGYYDPSPVNTEYFSPETPSLNSIGLTAGLSLNATEKLSIDLSFLYIIGMEGEREYLPDNFSGTFKTRTYIPGIGFTLDL